MYQSRKHSPTPFETLTPQTHGGEYHIESFEQQMPIDVTFIESEAGTVGCEMSYRDDTRHDTVATPPKRMAGTAFNWQGGPALSDTPTGRPAPVVVAAQRIVVQAPTMSVRVSAFGQAAKFSDLPIAA